MRFLQTYFFPRNFLAMFIAGYLGIYPETRYPEKHDFKAVFLLSIKGEIVWPEYYVLAWAPVIRNYEILC